MAWCKYTWPLPKLTAYEKTYFQGFTRMVSADIFAVSFDGLGSPLLHDMIINITAAENNTFFMVDLFEG